jgi:hypothetical protein
MGKTEILDVAPMDMLHSISKQFANDMSISDKLKAKMLDIEFHWVTEKARPAKLTAGITMKATASPVPCQYEMKQFIDGVLGFYRTLLRRVLRLISSSRSAYSTG